MGSGGQGCVYTPPLRCLDTPTPEGDVVSKLTTAVYAEAEIQEKELIAQVDPDQQYTVYAFAGCTPAAQTAEEARENPVDECMVHVRYPMDKGRHLLFFPNGGIDLFEFRVPPNKPIPFFEGLRNIIRGVSLFHKNNLVHMDIKPENMVSKWLPDTQSYLIRHIDFGFAFLTTKLPLANTGKFWSRNYVIWPYETRFLYPDFREEMITEESVQQFIQNSLLPNQYIFPISRFNKYTAFFYKTVWRRYSTMTYEHRVDHIAKATDVYSLGKALSKIYYKWSKQYCGETEAVLQLPEGISDEIYIFSENLRTQVSNLFYFEFVTALMEPDPFQRAEAYEVDAMWTNVLQNLRTFYSMQGGRGRRRAKRSRKQKHKD